MARCRQYVFIWALLVLGVVSPRSFAAASPDVAVLIDVSGSMKQNDPANHRRSAYELLTRLLPANSHLASWRFAESVEPMVEVAHLDPDQRNKVLQSGELIHSHGRLTDIDAALARALDYFKHSATTEKHLILLTDGFIDLGNDPDRNLSSRNKVLSTRLHMAVTQGVKIHTIGLGGEADKDLLRRLALGSGGRYLQPTAEDLQKAFVTIFDTAVPAQRLPIEDKHFLVDSKVKEFTLLAFRLPHGAPVKLHAPSGRILDSANHPDSVRWDHANEYDLITVTHPESGSWSLETELQPESRVTVISDLELDVKGLPVNMAAGDKAGLRISLVGDGKVLRQKDFLMLTTVSVQQGVPGQLLETQQLYNGPEQGSVMAPDDGVFTTTIGNGLQGGSYIVRVRVDSKTFSRSREQLISIAGNKAELPETSGPVAISSASLPVKKVVKTEAKTPVWWWILSGGLALFILVALSFIGYLIYVKSRARRAKAALAATPAEEEEEGNDSHHSSR